MSYLNTVPLVWGMLQGPQRGRFELQFRTPSECADHLKSGAVDVGIVPSIEMARQTLELIPGAGIACRGPVRSILLISKVAPDKIKTLAVDNSSRTSVVLAQIILKRRYGSEPALLVQPPYLPAMLRDADAALLIGDPALRLDIQHIPAGVLDLGGEWWDMTGRPMVFAVWACTPKVACPGLARDFAGSCRYGIEHLEDYVEAEARTRRIPVALARQYLTRHIVNELSEEEYEGMRLFHRYAADSGIVVSSGGAHGS